MLRLISTLFLCMLLMSACDRGTENLIVENDETTEQIDVDELKTQIEKLETENAELLHKVDEYKDIENDLWDKIKELQYERDSYIREETDYETDVISAYEMAVDYRNDIADIIEVLNELNQDDDYKFHGLDYLTEEQRLAIIDGVENHPKKTLEDEKSYLSSYESREFIGTKPEPYNLYFVIGITETTPMFYTSEEGNDTVHVSVYYYSGDVWIGPGEDAQIYFRGPFAGVSAIHVVIEKTDDGWKTVYSGLG